jgi:Uma2 family endonuclease
MGSPVHRSLTYDDLLAYPEENWPKRELFDGELVVSPSPGLRHSRVQFQLLMALGAWAEPIGADVHGGFDLEVSKSTGTYLWPDVMVVFADRVELVGDRPGKAPPDVVVEISSPSTHTRALIRKRAYYQQVGGPEYWFVDLANDRILLFALEDGRYGEPEIFGQGETLVSDHLKGFSAPVDNLLGLNPPP